MVDIRRILVPIDFSEPSREALRHAAALAHWYHAHITMMHAVSPMFVPGPLAIAPGITDAVGVSDYAMAHLENELRDWAEDAGIEPRDCDVVVELGDPSGHIIAASERLADGMIVLGSHGRRGFQRFVLGSVTERVLHNAACPVLTVPPRSVGTAVVPFKRVLCALDFSRDSEAAADYAFSIASEADASLTLLHVIDWPEEVDNLAMRDAAVGEMRRQREEEAQRRLENLATKQHVARWVTTRVDHGRAYERIVALAVEERADLLVLGAHRPNVLKRAFVGSTANHVVREASCPVLTLRGAAAGEEVLEALPHRVPVMAE